MTDKLLETKVEFCGVFHKAVKHFFATEAASAVGELYNVLKKYEEAIKEIEGKEVKPPVICGGKL